jgi:hypothetical protein
MDQSPRDQLVTMTESNKVIKPCYDLQDSKRTTQCRGFATNQRWLDKLSTLETFFGTFPIPFLVSAVPLTEE